jgi:pimeloyl-ACP methyl ester carboxylesterase
LFSIFFSHFSGLYLDAAAAMDYLLTRTDINLNKIIIFGRSLGGAVAVNLATHPVHSHNICALILENTFSSLPDIGRTLFNFQIINSLPDWCFKNQVGIVMNLNFKDLVRSTFYGT